MWIWNQCDQRVYMLRQCWDKQKTKFAYIYIYIYIKEFKSRKKDQKQRYNKETCLSSTKTYLKSIKRNKQMYQVENRSIDITINIINKAEKILNEFNRKSYETQLNIFIKLFLNYWVNLEKNSMKNQREILEDTLEDNENVICSPALVCL